MRNWVMTCIASSLGVASALGYTDITIQDNDANESAAGWYGPQEDNEISPSSGPGQIWDLEKFVLADDGTLWLIGGYDFKDGFGQWAPGHLFVSTDGTVNYGQTTVGQPGSATGAAATVPNSLYDYEFALVPDFDAGTYASYGLTDDELLAVFFGLNESSNPWKLDLARAGQGSLGGSLLFLDYGTAALTDLLNDLSGSGISFLDAGGSDVRYAVGLQGFTTAVGGGDFVVHYSYECGNDQIMGSVAVADAGATLLLIGISLLGLEAMRRRNPQAH